MRATKIPCGNGADDAELGRKLGAALLAPDLRAAIVLSDGLNVNGTALAKGIAEEVGPDIAVTGGLAGDGARFGATWGRLGEDREGAAIIGIGLYGDDLVVSTGSRGGWGAFSPEREVSLSDGNVLHELDGQPALALYMRYLGDRATGLPATALLFPLGIQVGGRLQPLVRTVLSVDEEKQTMTFAGDIPAGSRVQRMRAHLERLVDGAANAREQASVGMNPTAPAFALAVSCVGRRLVLGSNVDEEIEALLEACPKNTTTAGLYS